MNPVRIALRVLRSDARTRLSAVLTMLGVTAATTLILILTTLPHAAEARGQRASWQTNGTAGGQPTPSLVTPTEGSITSKDYVSGRKMIRLDVTAERRYSGPQPRMPGPGEVLLSPKLAELGERLPPGRLAARFPGRVTGSIDEQYLRFPGQLVAVVGHAPGTLSPETAEKFLARTNDAMLWLIAPLGIVLLAVPGFVLVGSAARLTAARRERRLAALRLSGATPAQVVGTVVAETGIAAVVGTVLGALLLLPSRFLVAMVPWSGGTWMVSDFTPSSTSLLVVGLAVPVTVVLAAVSGLYRVVRSPLGAAMEHSQPPPRKIWRAVLVAAVAVAFGWAVGSAEEAASYLVLALALGAVMLCASVLGPLVTSWVGKLFVRTWRGPSTLLAGRRLRDAPKAAYRSASGVVLAVFVGTLFLSLLPGAMSRLDSTGRSFEDPVLYADVPTAQAARLRQRMAEELDRGGTDATVVRADKVRVHDAAGNSYSALVVDCARAREVSKLEIGSCQGPPALHTTSRELPSSGLSITPRRGDEAVPLPPDVAVDRLPSQQDYLNSSVMIDPGLLGGRTVAKETTLAVAPPPGVGPDRVRTAMVRAAPAGLEVTSLRTYTLSDRVTRTDLYRVTAIGLGLAGLLAGVSAAIATAGSVVDRRRTFGALIAAGTPVRVLARAIRTEAALPALVATIGTGAAGIAVGAGLAGLFDFPLVLTPWQLVPVIVGVGVAVLASAGATPMLRKVAAEPLREE